MLRQESEEYRTVWSDASDLFLNSAPGCELLRCAAGGRPLNVTGAADPAKSFIVASLAEKTRRKVCVLVPDEARGRALHEELSAFIPEEAILTFHSRELSLIDVRAISRDQELMRSAVLTRLLCDDFRVLILPADATLQRVRPPDIFRRFVLTVELGQRIDPDTLERQLARRVMNASPRLRIRDNTRGAEISSMCGRRIRGAAATALFACLFLTLRLTS